MLSTATAAVSVRRMFGPRLTRWKPLSFAISASCAENPPSGPMRTMMFCIPMHLPENVLDRLCPLFPGEEKQGSGFRVTGSGENLKRFES